MASISTRRIARPGLGFLSGLGLALLGLAAGALIALAIGAGVRTSLLVAGAVAPFALLVVFARPHWAVLVYAVLVYANLLSTLVEYQGLPPLARLAGAGLLSSVLGYRLVVRKGGLIDDAMTWWLGAYGVLVALGLIYARAPDLVAPELIEFGRNFLTYLVIINTITTIRRMKGVVFALLAMGVVLASLTVFQTITGDFSQDFGGLAQSKITGITELTDASRPGGTVADANYYGQNLLIVFPLALFLASRGIRPAARMFGILASIVLVAAIVFTYSRGDLLALAVVIVAAIIYKRPRPPVLVGGLMMLALLLVFLPANYYARLGSLVDVAGGDRSSLFTESSLRGRAGAATAAVAMFADHPFLGVGRNNYPLYELDYLRGTSLAQKSHGISPHDLYLETAAEQGVIGLIVLGGILVVSAQALFEARRRFTALGDDTQAELTVWFAIGLLGYLVTSIFLHGAYLYMLWLQIALIVAMRQIARLQDIATEDYDELPSTGPQTLSSFLPG
jgi:O-antigen ligase